MIIYNNFVPVKGYTAINLMGIIFIRNDCKDKVSKTLLNHEKIHGKQMKELLFVPFYFLYVMEWLVRLVISPKTAYKSISFERECYSSQSNLGYIKTRKRFNWIKYIV